MRPHSARSPLATLAVGTAVFGGAVAWLSRSGPRDPRVALAGLMAALVLTTALLLLIWARRRTDARERVGRAVVPVPGQAKGTGLTLIDLGQGQAAVIFDEPAGPGDRPHGAGHHRISREREAERDATAICDAVSAAAAASPPAPARKTDPGSLWHRLRFGRRKGPDSDFPPDSR